MISICTSSRVTWQELRWIHWPVCQKMSRRYVLELMRNHVTLKIVTIEIIWKKQPGLCQRNMSMCSNKSSHILESNQRCRVRKISGLTSFDLRSRATSIASVPVQVFRPDKVKNFWMPINRYRSELTLFDLIWPSVWISAHLIGMTSVHKMVYHTFGMSFITSSICKYLKRLKILIWTLLNPPSCLTSSLKPLSSDFITF